MSGLASWAFWESGPWWWFAAAWAGAVAGGFLLGRLDREGARAARQRRAQRRAADPTSRGRRSAR